MTENKTINLTVGWTFLLLGVAGIILPILQGVLFFVVGLLFLSKEYTWAGNLLNRLRTWTQKHSPRAAKIFTDAENFIDGEVKKMATEKDYLKKKIWIIIAVVLFLGLIGWVLALLFGWLKDVIFG